jgi:AcrR family transcriptional regulator
MSVADVAVTASQRARRERILQAALELALGGYDAVQMREVADKADVALGTLYRYFPSKVHLLVAAMAEELDRLKGRALRTAPADGDAVERVMQVCGAVTNYLGRNRNLSAALVRALMFADGSVAGDVDRVAAIMTSIISTATHGVGEPATPEDTTAALIIGKVWLSDIVSWLGERMTLPEMMASMRLTVETVMSGVA